MMIVSDFREEALTSSAFGSRKPRFLASSWQLASPTTTYRQVGRLFRTQNGELGKLVFYH